MKSFSAVFAGDRINKYGMVMPVSVLESALGQSWNSPRPSSISHDLHRATGWSRATALHLQPGLARLCGEIVYAENDSEMGDVQSVVNHALSERLSNLDQAEIDDLKNILGEHLSDEHTLFPESCTAILDPRIVRRMFPEVFQNTDKSGLVPLSSLNPVGPGVFERDGILIFAHPYFRRSLSRFNTLNDPFLGRLTSMASPGDYEIRIAIDEDLVGLSGTLLKSIELEYWWGPKFSDDLPKIDNGVTRHESSKTERFFYGISGTEFWWYELDGLKTFECEEIKDLDLPSLGISTEKFGCRFVHSIVDPETEEPRHLDGAIRLYDEESMLARVDSDILHSGRNAEYKKLWRIDGPISLCDWKALISDFYRDNRLVGEYFGGEEEHSPDVQASLVESGESDSIHQFVPNSMNVGDGVRISISYHPKSDSSERWRIVPLSFYARKDGSERYYVEADSVELVKMIRRQGGSVDLPDDVDVVAFEDLVSNFPFVMHSGENSVSDAQVTLAAIREIVNAVSKTGDNRMLGFHIGISYHDRDAFFSFVGQIGDVMEWINSECTSLPSDVSEVRNWATLNSKWLTETFPQAREIPPLENALKGDGLLTSDRKFLNPKLYDFERDQAGKVGLRIVRTPDVDAASPLIEEGRMQFSHARLIRKAKCESCGESYFDCPCVLIVDEDASYAVTKSDFYGVFFTDRSAEVAEDQSVEEQKGKFSPK